MCKSSPALLWSSFLFSLLFDFSSERKVRVPTVFACTVLRKQTMSAGGFRPCQRFFVVVGFVFFSRHTGVFHLFTVVHENLSCTLTSPLQRCFLWLAEHVRMVWIDSLRHTVPKVKRMSSSVLSLNSIISSSAKLGHRVLIVLG